MARTRLRVSRKKAMRVTEERFDILVKLIKEVKTPMNAFDLNYQRNRIAAWRAATRESLPNVFDDSTAYSVGSPKDVFPEYGIGHDTSLRAMSNDNFRGMWDDHSALIQMKARIPHMPRVPRWEKMVLTVERIGTFLIARKLQSILVFTLLLIVLTLLAIIAPEAFAKVAELISGRAK